MGTYRKKPVEIQAMRFTVKDAIFRETYEECREEAGGFD
jgi:hypothetical protein